MPPSANSWAGFSPLPDLPVRPRLKHRPTRAKIVPGAFVRCKRQVANTELVDKSVRLSRHRVILAHERRNYPGLALRTFPEPHSNGDPCGLFEFRPVGSLKVCIERRPRFPLVIVSHHAPGNRLSAEYPLILG